MDKRLIIPPKLKEFLKEINQTLPQYNKPKIIKSLSPKQLKKIQKGINLFLVSFGCFILIKEQNLIQLILWTLGVISLNWGINNLLKSVIKDYYLMTQTNNQAKRYQYEQAQNLLKRYQNRKLREFFKNKIKRGKIKGYCLNESQKANYQQLKAKFPHWHIQIGEKVNEIIIPVSLVNPKTGLAIAVFFELPREEEINQLLEAYWVIWHKK